MDRGDTMVRTHLGHRPRMQYIATVRRVLSVQFMSPGLLTALWDTRLRRGKSR